MAIRIVQLGTPIRPEEGLRLGVVRRPPRGVRKEDYARRDYFDVWYPDLAPSAELVKFYHEEEPISDARWARYRPRCASTLLGRMLRDHGAEVIDE